MTGDMPEITIRPTPTHELLANWISGLETTARDREMGVAVESIAVSPRTFERLLDELDDHDREPSRITERVSIHVDDHQVVVRPRERCPYGEWSLDDAERRALSDEH